MKYQPDANTKLIASALLAGLGATGTAFLDSQSDSGFFPITVTIIGLWLFYGAWTGVPLSRHLKALLKLPWNSEDSTQPDSSS